MKIHWEKNYLTLIGRPFGGASVQIQYMEAFCKPGSKNRLWEETVIPHVTHLTEMSSDEKKIRLQSDLSDGVVVRHTIQATEEEIQFHLIAENPTQKPSLAHWAQPCIHAAPFLGMEEKVNSEEYLSRCFIFLDGKEKRLPFSPWSKEGVYLPGQCWCPTQVPRTDVNPRPLNPLVPSNGLIGCYSADGKKILATAWEPYQELFVGIFVCIHSDPRIGGLLPGEKKEIRGKIYVVDADPAKLLERYERDFPEHQARSGKR